MRALYNSLFILTNECLNKLCFICNKTFANKKLDVSLLKSLLVCVAMLLLFSSCEQKNIHAEIVRLQGLEKELNKAISENNTERAKLICVQMKWEYVPTTVGADVKCKKLAEIWDDKRRNYLKIIGIDPIEILGEKPKPKTLQERLLDTE
jgi:hypothetical protein